MKSSSVRFYTVIISALLYAFAFIWPSYCCWFIFLFLIPLFYIVEPGVRYRFCDGLLWGLIFFGITMYSFLRVILDYGNGSCRVLAFVFLIIYCSLYSGLWFFISVTITSHLTDNIRGRVYCWIISSFCFFYWVDHGILWIFGRFEGYPFALPLLPLAYYPAWLASLAYCGTSLLLFLLITFSGIVVIWLHEKQTILLIGALLCFLPFIAGWCMRQKKEIASEYLDIIVAIMPPKSTRHPIDVAQEIVYRLMACCKKYPRANVFIMPESSYPFPLNDYPEVFDMWYQNILFDEKVFIIGAHRREADRLYNTCYCIKEDRIIQLYDKKHSIPFVEYLPSHLNNFSHLQNLFLLQKEKFNVATKLRNTFSLTKNLKVIPYICSELFFAKYKEIDESIPLLCIVNDSWFSTSYMRTLLYLTARYKAQEWQCDILYVSHYLAQLLTKTGQHYDMPSI